MPQTTSAINACDVGIFLDDGGGTYKDISGSSNEVSLDLLNTLGQLHTFGSRFPVRLECKSDAAITLKVIYTQSDAEALEILKDWFFTTRGQKSLRIDLPDSNPGSDRYSFEVFLEKLTIPLKSDDANPILVQADLKPTGTFSTSVIAS